MDSTQKPEEITDDKQKLIFEKSAALSLLQQYTCSDSENEEEENDDKLNLKYRTAASSSSSSSSSSDSEEELDLNQIRKKLDASITDDEEEGEGDEEGGISKINKKKEPLKVKGELLLEDLPPIENLEIQVDEKECLELGTISSIVDQLVLVEAYSHSAPLDIDSVLFLDMGKKALGKIFDVIGQVSSPIYCVRFNSHNDIIEKNITVGQKVFCAPRTEYTSYVILQNIMGKGSDASWKNDVEVPDNLVDYSDDEQERGGKKNSRTKLTARRRLPPNNQDYGWHNANSSFGYHRQQYYPSQNQSYNYNNRF
ncbi:hypothetical protein PVAND_002383 [Polypedilum vanderplanki]|uniref:H/ACA ribonucleoprotein complex subunit n=1 Tax=Polypedilum vanderplanki TaxID=319348 RepID=A0A9J6BQT6_POLVA|nr:hypothetical protein PVAND_002383 [Polypedilum vanderplanki]